jgi:hypothetical protein
MTRVHPNLAAAYQHARATVSDIFEHLPTLYRYASCCRHVTEFGTRTGVSTLALLRALPERLISYDWVRLPDVDRLEQLARLQGVDFSFRQEDTRRVDLEPTDLLFIDTLHVRQQLEAELAVAGERVRRFLIFHDTETFGQVGEDGGEGIWPAIAAFVRRESSWRLLEHRPANNGLTVLWRCRKRRAIGRLMPGRWHEATGPLLESRGCSTHPSSITGPARIEFGQNSLENDLGVELARCLFSHGLSI